MLDLFKNLIVNLKATGPAAVMIAWVIAVAAVGIFGSSQPGGLALVVLEIFGIMVVAGLVQKIN